ncbi:uncharacterized protein LOC110445411 isoform X3 [Mizuhopecten yessoensis]|uniref:uncharacterized protein LOC110445411 isoform X3 n=1 Tax=Mizuhopecten yessoensis TaxID=6573 RepID=UPI000B45E3E0|nr:uncharacterized protein LOC110445411 isoform X3 [Mizuhopecten yessoensis]
MTAVHRSIMTISSCNAIAQVTDVLIDLSTYNTSEGTVVSIGCKRFGHRVVGPQNVTCLNTSNWSDTTQPKCAWTGDLNTYEKLVIGVAASCIILLLICLVLIISLVIYRHSRRRHKEDSKKPIDTELDNNQYYYQNERNGHIQNGAPLSDYARGNYHNQAYDNRDPDHRYVTEITTNPSNQEAYRWNGHIPRPKLGPEGREPF